jgi:hypothetical protein
MSSEQQINRNVPNGAVYVVACNGQDTRLDNYLRNDIESVWNFCDQFMSENPPSNWLGNYSYSATTSRNNESHEFLFGTTTVQEFNITFQVLYNPNLNDFQKILANSPVHVALFFCGHGTILGELILEDGPVDPRVLFEPWLKRDFYIGAKVVLNCCYGLLISQLLKGDETSLFVVAEAFAVMKDADSNSKVVTDALIRQAMHIMDERIDTYWLSDDGKNDIAVTAVFFGVLDSYAQSLISFGKHFIRVNPIALGPISGVGWLKEVLGSKLKSSDTQFQSCLGGLSKSISEGVYRFSYGPCLSDLENHFNTKQKLEISQSEKLPAAVDVEVFQFASSFGDTTLWRYGDTNILIDGGQIDPTESFWKIVKDLPHLDLVILTHGDQDHFTGLGRLFKSSSVENGFHVKKFLLLMPGAAMELIEEFLKKEDGENAAGDSRNFGHSVLYAALARQNGIEVDNHDGSGIKENCFKENIIVKTWGNEFMGDAIEWLRLPALNSESKKPDGNVVGLLGTKGVSLINCAGLCVMIEVRCKSGLWRGLFTGDCRVDPLIEHDVFSGRNNSNFDFVDIPHHGSSKNWTSDFMKFCFLNTNSVVGVSTDGGKKHGHPNESVMKDLKDTRVKLTFPFKSLGTRVLPSRSVKEMDMWNSQKDSGKWKFLPEEGYHLTKWKLAIKEVST